MMLLILVRVDHSAAGLLALIWLHRTSADVGLRAQIGQTTDIEQVAPHLVRDQGETAMLRRLITEPRRAVIARIPCC